MENDFSVNIHSWLSVEASYTLLQSFHFWNECISVESQKKPANSFIKKSKKITKTLFPETITTYSFIHFYLFTL